MYGYYSNDIIYLYGCDYCEITDNTISNSYYNQSSNIGIDVSSSNNMLFKNNIINVDANYGLDANNCGNSIIEDNTITGFRKYGINSSGSQNIIINNNTINSTMGYESYSDNYGIYHTSGNNTIIKNNEILMYNAEGADDIGIYSNYALIDSNVVIIQNGSSNNSCISGHNNLISNNTLQITGNSSSEAINITGINSDDTPAQIINNTIYFESSSYGIIGNYLNILGNNISG